jgi:hypothetical protein
MSDAESFEEAMNEGAREDIELLTRRSTRATATTNGLEPWLSRRGAGPLTA